MTSERATQRRLRTAVCTACFLIGALLARPVSAHAQAQSEAVESDAYRALVSEAVSEFDAGHWEEARSLFRRAHSLAPNARTLRGLGMCAYELRDYAEAARMLANALTEPRRALTSEQQAQTRTLLDRAHGFVARYTIAAAATDDVVRVDGAPARREADGSVVLAMGTHTVTLLRDARVVGELTVRVNGGEHAALELRAPTTPDATAGNANGAPRESAAPRDGGGSADGGDADPAPADTRRSSSALAPILLASAGVFAVASVIGAVWWIDRGDAVDACDAAGVGCLNRSDLASERTTAVVFTLGSAGVAAVLAGVGFALVATTSDTPDAARVACAPSLGGFACVGAF